MDKQPQTQSFKKNKILWYLFLSGIIILTYKIGYYNNVTPIETSDKLLSKISMLSKENSHLKELLSQRIACNNRSSEPSLEYENLKRQISNNIQTFWNFIDYNVKMCQKQVNKNQDELKRSLNNILNIGIQHKRNLLECAKKLDFVDGYSSWRIEESKNLINLVESRLRYLQNPTNCETAKKIVCPLKEFVSGFGSTFHHVISCVLIGYDLKRTVILDTAGFNYGSGSWEEYFKPISDTCVSYNDKAVTNWPGNASSQVIRLRLITSLRPYPPYLPTTIPSDLQFRLERLHGNPTAWWIGQIAAYLFKLNNITEDYIDEIKNELGYKRPIVGVHVRRTDKKKEARYYPLKQYMDEVDEYFNQNFYNSEQRRIYLATDETLVLEEATAKYSHYKLLTNNKSLLGEPRYNRNSLKGLLIDIYLLSNADFLVCTFSSNLCRLAYELMQYKYPDASDRFKSLDHYYHYGGIREPFSYEAINNYNSNISDHLELKKGDKIYMNDGNWNGYSKGRNVRTKKQGNSSSQVIRLPIITALRPYPPYLPMAIPSDLKYRIERLHGNPKAWWIGQIATYLFRLNNKTQNFINEYKNKLGFKRPVVGVHIRRTDKRIEAKYYDLKEYIDKVDEYFNQNLHNETDQRSVYLATDEIRVIKEAKEKYSHYKILTNNETIVKEHRYSTDSLKGLLVDIYLLSNADFLVCTFSSNICRLAYELMQYKYPDAYDRFKSLDRYFFYGGRTEPFTHIAIKNYKSSITEHLELEKGDRIYIDNISENLYSNGSNIRTRKNGIFPTFLVKEHFRSHNYPKYEEVDV